MTEELHTISAAPVLIALRHIKAMSRLDHLQYSGASPHSTTRTCRHVSLIKNNALGFHCVPMWRGVISLLRSFYTSQPLHVATEILIMKRWKM